MRCEGEVTKVADADGATVISLTQRVRVGDRVAIDGATMDVEWNYVQSKLMRALGVIGPR